MSSTLKFPEALFITGTDTDVGKTVVAAILTKGMKGAYWKPIQTGIDSNWDSKTVKQLTGLNEKHFLKEAYAFKASLSPHAAAKLEFTEIELETVHMPNFKPFPHLIVEGAGGVMVPLNDHHFMLDLIKKLNIPAMVVCRSSLGTINHTLLTIDKIRQYGIPLFGVVINGPINESNKNAISKYGKVDIIAELEPLPTLHPEVLNHVFEKQFLKNNLSEVYA